MSTTFGNQLLRWHEDIDRVLPWKSTKDPYKIWLSEIILQQTRVEQGTPYYLKFIELFPTVYDLAEAHEDKVLLAWQGLGYYSRARNLHAAAKIIVEKYNGDFPSTYQEILSLKGIGPYTAAAIASFAYDLPHPVLDGNVKRVISRYFGISAPIDASMTIKEINSLLQSVFLPQKAAQFNQAIMDFGALQCTPKKTDCATCPFNTSCVAYNKNIVDHIPFKLKKVTKTNRYFHYFILRDQEYILLHQRSQKGIWQGLHDFPLLEKDSAKAPSKDELMTFLDSIVSKQKFKIQTPISLPKHVLSHQNLHIKLYIVDTDLTNVKIKVDYKLVEKKNLENFAFPIILRNHLHLLEL